MRASCIFGPLGSVQSNQTWKFIVVKFVLCRVVDSFEFI